MRQRESTQIIVDITAHSLPLSVGETVSKEGGASVDADLDLSHWIAANS